MSTRDYEAMFLLDSDRASADFDGTAALVDQIITKQGAQIVQKEKWDERKLAYDIRGHRRATYYLVYFRGPPAAIKEINRDAELNEVILRHLVMLLDEPIEEHVTKRAGERERLAEESRRASLAGWGERKRGGGRRDGRRSDDEDDVIGMDLDEEPADQGVGLSE